MKGGWKKGCKWPAREPAAVLNFPKKQGKWARELRERWVSGRTNQELLGLDKKMGCVWTT